jgi:hypothetical protein
MKARAERFGGASSETAKKQLRAERFGVTTTGSTGSIISAPAADLDKLKQRAERFGTVVSNKLSKVCIAIEKKKRNVHDPKTKQAVFFFFPQLSFCVASDNLYFFDG